MYPEIGIVVLDFVIFVIIVGGFTFLWAGIADCLSEYIKKQIEKED